MRHLCTILIFACLFGCQRSGDVSPQTDTADQTVAVQTANGQTSTAAATSAEDPDQLRAAREAARTERLRRAREAEDAATMRPVATDEASTVATADPDKATAHGDEAIATNLFNSGCEIMARAQEADDLVERYELYGEAELKFQQAMALYGRLGMDREAIMANQYRYACIKFRRFADNG